MAYCTTDQLQELVGAPIEWGEGLAPAEADVTDMIGRNGDTIDGFCRARYTVPWVVVPAAIESICLDLCLAEILPIVFFKNAEQLTRAERLRAWAMQRLDRIQQGRMSIEEDDQASQGMGGQVTASTVDTDAIFTIGQQW